MGQQVLTVVGAVAGAAVAYFSGGNVPLGFAIGSAIGGVAGSALFPTKISGPHTNPYNTMSGSYGATLPLVVGNARIATTLIDQDPHGIQEVGTNQGGKGGPQVTTYAYYGWFAVALCRGPILGIRRIWANKILIYDVSSTATPATVTNSNQFAGRYMTMYLGDGAQNPDATLQSWHGAGLTPAYRGTAYIVFRGLPLVNYANVLPSIEAEVTTAGASITPAKIWENDATGFPFAVGTDIAFATGFSGGMARAICRTMATAAGNDGNAYRLLLTDGTLESNDSPSAFENSITSNYGGGHFFGDPSANPMALVMPHAGRSCGVFSAHIADSSSGNITLSPQGSSGTGASLYVCEYSSGTRLGDVLSVITKPAGITGTWRLVGAFPCADWQHVAAITKDSGGTGNFWLHVVAVTGAGVPSELAYYLFTNPTEGDQAASLTYSGGVPGSWTDPIFDRPAVSMLESSLTSMWTFDGSGGGATARYFKVGANGQITQVGSLVYSALIGVGWASFFADTGVMVLFSQIYAHCVSASQLGATTTVPLSTVVATICEETGLQSSQLDVTALTDGVWGYVLDRPMAARAALEAITQPWWFDAVESDGKLKFVHRSGTSLATITIDDMVVEPGSTNVNPIQFTRGSEIELPSQVNLTYYSISGMYQQGMQYARRLTGLESNNVQAIDTAGVMDDTQAAVAAAVIMFDAVAGRVSFKFSTSYKWAQYEPTDILTIQTLNESYLARCTRKTENGPKIDWEFVACAPVYSQPATGGAINAAQDVSGDSPTTAIIMDIPPLRDQDGAGANLYVAMYGPTGWPGATLYKSSDGGVTFVAGVAMGTPSTAGRASTALGNWLGQNEFDEGNTVTVTILSGQTLSSVPELTVLNGGNVAYLGGEIIQFKNATLVSTGTYKLSGLLRGRFATEYKMATHSVGEPFVLLSSPGVVALQAIPTSDIGQPRVYDAVTSGQAIPTGQQQTITAKGNTLVCFSPVLLNAGGAGYYNDIVLTWTRRNRLTWQWLQNVDVPMSEASEQYLVSIFSGASVVRTFTVTGAQTVTYTLAQQITDFGGSGLTSVTFGVQQISAVTGPGNMAKATITLPAHGYIPVTYTQALAATQATSAALATSLIHAQALAATQGSTATLSTQLVSAVNALFLCHFDGTNGQTTYTDVYGHTMTNHGAALSTTNPKWGTACLECSGNYVQVANDAAFTVGTGDATLEGWVNWISGNNQVYLSKRTGTSSNSWFLFDNFSAFFFYINKGGALTQIGNSVATPTTNTWHHFALVKSGTTAMLFWDGVQQGATLTGITGSVTDDGSDIVIGAGGTDGSFPANDVKFDDVRYSNVARYTSNFTPPAAPFAN